MTLRRLYVLVAQLPAESRTKARLAGDRDGRRWSELVALTADIHELLQAIRIEQLAGTPTDERIELPRLSRVPRPVFDPDDPDDDGVDSGADDGETESVAERFARIQRFLSQFDPPSSVPSPSSTPSGR